MQASAIYFNSRARVAGSCMSLQVAIAPDDRGNPRV